MLTRAALRSRLEEVEHESQVPGARVSVIAFDIDDFKGINDAHGHATGDEVLRATGAALRSQLHALEWAFRLGGDEFLVVVPGGQHEAHALAERIRGALTIIEVDGVRFTGSFGVAESTPGARFDFEGVSRRADAALYEAKRAGRNCVAVAPPPVISASSPISALTSRSSASPPDATERTSYLRPFRLASWPAVPKDGCNARRRIPHMSRSRHTLFGLAAAAVLSLTASVRRWPRRPRSR